MDVSPIVDVVLRSLWWLIPIALLSGLLQSPWLKGVAGEFFVKLAAWIRLPADLYHPIHNVTLPTPDGTTQIDHIFVSRYGIFVAETKNMKGWIFGDQHQAQWTQKIYKKTFKFQNPLRQNYKHLKALEAALDLPAEAIHSVIVFAGDAKFKTEMPPNVTQAGGYIRYIKSFSSPILSEEQVQSAIATIKSGRLEPTRETHLQHVKALKARSDINALRKCPKCGSAMILRTAKRGAAAGNQFWGCSAYPHCKTVQNLA